MNNNRRWWRFDVLNLYWGPRPGWTGWMGTLDGYDDDGKQRGWKRKKETEVMMSSVYRKSGVWRLPRYL